MGLNNFPFSRLFFILYYPISFVHLSLEVDKFVLFSHRVPIYTLAVTMCFSFYTRICVMCYYIRTTLHWLLKICSNMSSINSTQQRM